MNWTPRSAVLATVVLAGILTGCGGDDPSPSGNGDGRTSNGNGGHAIGPVEIDPASITLADWQGVQEMVARHQGKIVVVYLWATFNQPAVNELPQLARLCRQHADDVSCISVNLDYGEGGEEPETLRAAVAAELGSQGADFEHVISTTPAETLYEEIDLVTGIPAVYVYNREGELARRFDNEDPEQPEFSFRKDVAPFVAQLIDGK